METHSGLSLDVKRKSPAALSQRRCRPTSAVRGSHADLCGSRSALSVSGTVCGQPHFTTDGPLVRFRPHEARRKPEINQRDALSESAGYVAR